MVEGRLRYMQLDVTVVAAALASHVDNHLQGQMLFLEFHGQPPSLPRALHRLLPPRPCQPICAHAVYGYLEHPPVYAMRLGAAKEHRQK